MFPYHASWARVVGLPWRPLLSTFLPVNWQLPNGLILLSSAAWWNGRKICPRIQHHSHHHDNQTWISHDDIDVEHAGPKADEKSPMISDTGNVDISEGEFADEHNSDTKSKKKKKKKKAKEFDL